MRKYLLILLLLAAGCTGYAQVVINLQLPPLGLTIKPQLWNLSLVNSGKTTTYARVEVVMTDVATNQRVLTGTTNMVSVPAGVRQLQLRDLLPITYNPGTPGYVVDPSPEGFLPTGVFNICYSILQVNSDYVERIGEECETVEIEPISPPQLMTPLDEEQVDISRPLFAWVPPSPYSTLNGLLYDWILVEVQATQSPADAVQQNIPILSRQNIAYTNFQYPLSAPELDSTRLYAWRVTAKNNLLPIGNSEVWSFRLRRPIPDSAAIFKPGGFAKLNREENASYTVARGILRFEYLNDLNTASVQLKLFDISSSRRQQVQLDNSTGQVRLGQNLLQIDLRQQRGMVNKHVYLLEVTNAHGEKGYLKFEFRE
ncbi:hypothetical protein [Paraflavitalea pollutisoli]|uniref:hypothetical protein n=1 Tax=Paraflavitalea pollutisoli TaxID=3034143 RepID=UPI0023EDC38C|nr:hypothetical protein [Paraflavitalea sp. H1-2-19X]